MKATLVKLAAFVLVSAACTGWLVARIGQVTGSAGLLSHTSGVTAEFTDATGLVGGDEVRLSGVRIGKVGKVSVERGKAVVKLRLDKSHPVPAGSHFELHWKNLLGQRYVEVLPPPDAQVGGPVLAAGTHIGTDRTRAAADLTALLDQTEPLLARLDTDSLNRVMATFAAAMQGREDELSHAIDQGSELLATLSTRADVIGRSVSEFATLVDGIAGHDQQVRQFLDSMAATAQTLATHADDLGDAAGKAGQFTTALSRVLAANDKDIDAVFGQVHKVLDGVVANKASLQKGLQTLPWTTAAILRMTSWGDWIQSYTRGFGIIDAYGSEPRIGPNYNDVGPDDPQGKPPVLGQPRVPVPPIPSTDLGVVAVNPQPGAPQKSSGPGGLGPLLDPLTGNKK